METWPLGSAPGTSVGIRLVEQRDAGASSPSLSSRSRPAFKRDSHRFEVGGVTACEGAAILVPPLSGSVLEVNAIELGVAAQRQLNRECGARDAGHARDGIEGFLEESMCRAFLIVAWTDVCTCIVSRFAASKANGTANSRSRLRRKSRS